MALTSAARRPRRFLPGFMAGVLVACVLLVGLDGWRTWQNRTRELNEDKIATANLAASLAQQMHDAVAATDNALVGLRSRLETGDLSPTKLGKVHTMLVEQVDNLPTIHGLFVYDAAGTWIASSLAAMPSQANNSDRDYFIFHRDHADRSVHVGPPIRSRSDSSSIFTVSRRLNGPDGTFAGVVSATLSIDHLRDYYASFDVGRQGTLALLTLGGTMVARSPDDGRATGTDQSRSAVFQEMVQHLPVGSFEYLSSIDDVRRLGSYRQVEDYPLLVVVSHGLGDVLADWRSDAAQHLAISVGAATLLLLLGLRFATQVERQRLVEQRYRLLAEHSSDVIMCVGLDGRRLYVSPSFTAMTGWSVEETLRFEWGQRAHPGDQARLRDIRTQLLTGPGQVTTAFRYVCKDGSLLWVEAKIRLVEEQGSAPRQFIANIRDISERKVAEAQLEAVNRKLAVQASTDALTGLANRRCFDRLFDQEWRRAARAQVPVSLVLLDVDCFKLYNDRYGHQQGDECLRAVAAALSPLARRPGDLVARYGGEEFALLLPGAEEGAAAMVAEQARAAVQALALEHLGNAPLGVVTVSAGVATAKLLANAGPSAQRELVAVADAALYVAKRAGRNRVVSASGARAQAEATQDSLAADARKTYLASCLKTS